MDAFGQRNPFDFDMENGFLHLAEKASVSREVKCHLKKLAKDLVPLIYANPKLLVGYGGHNCFKPR